MGQDREHRRRQEFVEEEARLSLQQQERSIQRRNETISNAKLADMYRTDAQDAVAEEMQKSMQKRQDATMNVTFIRGQMEQRPGLGKFGHEQMSQAERTMNSQRFDRAKNETLALGKSFQLGKGDSLRM